VKLSSITVIFKVTRLPDCQELQQLKTSEHDIIFIWKLAISAILSIYTYNHGSKLQRYWTTAGYSKIGLLTTINKIPERLQDETEMVLVVEMTIKTKTMKLILGVGIIQTLQKFQLLQTSLVPDKNRQYIHIKHPYETLIMSVILTGTTV